MDVLILGIVIGTVYGRNMRHVNQQVYMDACKAATMLSRTQLGFGTLYLLETIVEAAESRRINNVTCMRSIVCECNRRNCPGRTVSIGYYARKLKAAE